MFLIEGTIHKQLLETIEAALPHEVGGIVIRGKEVQVLTNHSSKPESEFIFYLSELRDELRIRGVIDSNIDRNIVLWHSHPGGGVGPSREDVRNKTPLRYHLVLAYVDGDLVPTWY